MNEIGWVLLALTSTIVATNVALVVVVRRFYKRIRRNLALNNTGLRVRAGLSRGHQHEVLALQLRLRETINSGRAAIDLAVGSGGPHGELPVLFRRLTNEGVAVESQLRLLASENDKAVLVAALPAARSRVDEIAHLVRRLRSAVETGLGDTSDDSLTTLRSDVDREVQAVHAGMQELRDLNRRGGFSGSAHPPSSEHSARD